MLGSPWHSQSGISTRQIALHPSRDAVLPSSHCSVGLIRPAPQAGGPSQPASMRHLALQQSSPKKFPSSNSSPPSRYPFPQLSRVQSVQPSYEIVLPSSQTSPASRVPFPQ